MIKTTRLYIVLCLFVAGQPCLGATSLELALTKAFNAKVEDGTYARIFDRIADIKPTSFCTGNAASWETPPLETGETGGSDLATVLDRGEFVCGYPKDLFYQQSLQAGQVLIDTTDPNNVQGAIVDWWDELGKELGRMYGKNSFRVKWNATLERSQQVLAALQDGSIDSACGRWGPDGFYNDANGKKLPRSVAFSAQICSTYAQTGHIYTARSSNITSFSKLIAGIDNGTVKTITALGSTSGGTPQTCGSQLSQYTANRVSCTGVREMEAFVKLDDGSSDAHWEGIPLFPSRYNRFNQPSLYTPVSLFRTEDLAGEGATSGAVTVLVSATAGVGWLVPLVGVALVY